MKALFGAFLMIVGVVLGIYVGLWVMFAGGIKSIVAGSVLWGLIKMLLLLGCLRCVRQNCPRARSRATGEKFC
ncbi:MAG: hypothetical protein CO002_02995 [Candidatus Portnoybacteria bacterium CG_4_8_14_3_um_filter_44_10]|uniref:Uncharacterized protein n=4 Tax=Candidatus Portnoyibacteriota TaxID=1817913 RepID=A0A2H0KQG3_9BACT|nr:MAG: hypothetical protein COV85_02450 [Candidatus Portnoybacteria bacterium CG11_big_fil_rev_8_21_14_0_20_44_10]PIW75269.1 MAG: hypothetical protein CO002_02995 [Candidatus Portnoybacteria bacterium CG_4_8_14_3_um_filter_44_10]PIZ69779.1 MAG: hypothetical protein COY11_03915 [Candidatus Portnoybacteria bacterium CG_4_10_14_0_2_um_filter_44_20]PJA63133.1 MAG: hypothetical protein CO161_02705 [Candidatus Portnoybacteria bacterium CG_4_9_14_3_um_filter_44_9]